VFTLAGEIKRITLAVQRLQAPLASVPTSIPSTPAKGSSPQTKGTRRRRCGVCHDYGHLTCNSPCIDWELCPSKFKKAHSQQLADANKKRKKEEKEQKSKEKESEKKAKDEVKQKLKAPAHPALQVEYDAVMQLKLAEWGKQSKQDLSPEQLKDVLRITSEKHQEKLKQYGEKKAKLAKLRTDLKAITDPAAKLRIVQERLQDSSLNAQNVQDIEQGSGDTTDPSTPANESNPDENSDIEELRGQAFADDALLDDNVHS
jgi:hypothetical protein